MDNPHDEVETQEVDYTQPFDPDMLIFSAREMSDETDKLNRQSDRRANQSWYLGIALGLGTGLAGIVGYIAATAWLAP